MNWTEFDAALFDLDGVITPTADVHMAAWSRMFNAFLNRRGVGRPYTDSDYFAYVDGKPRDDGVRSFLASRGIALPDGTPNDSPDAETVTGLGNRKNAAFNATIAEEGITPYPGSVALIDFLAARGTPMAVVSSSRNAPAVLEAAGLADRFALVVDGALAARLGLAGKPAPDTYLYAAKALDAVPSRAVVLEDAVSGVASGRAGAFGLVVGVDRGAGRDGLLASGADVVITDLAELVTPEGAPA